MGSFEDDLEGTGAEAGRRAEHAVVAVLDDTPSGAEAVDDLVGVAGEDVFDLLEGGLDEVPGQSCPVSVAIETVAGIVGMEGDDCRRRRGR